MPWLIARVPASKNNPLSKSRSRLLIVIAWPRVFASLALACGALGRPVLCLDARHYKKDCTLAERERSQALAFGSSHDAFTAAGGTFSPKFVVAGPRTALA